MPPEAKTALAVVVAYFIGCLSPSYWLVRWATGRDLRSEGSGTLGATNAGELLGRKYYYGIALLDLLKGVAAYFFAMALGCEGWWLTAAGMAVVIGHIWPVTLGFHGGKGVATGAGVLIASACEIPALLFPVFLVLNKYTKKISVSGMICFALAIVVAVALYFLRWPREPSLPHLVLVTLLCLLVLWANRSNTIAEIKEPT